MPHLMFQLNRNLKMYVYSFSEENPEPNLHEAFIFYFAKKIKTWYDFNAFEIGLAKQSILPKKKIDLESIFRFFRFFNDFYLYQSKKATTIHFFLLYLITALCMYTLDP